jgi:Methyltransferase domain
MLKRLLNSLTAPPAARPSDTPQVQPQAVPKPFVGYVVLASQVMWVTSDGAYKSGLASTRLRTIIPAQHLVKHVPVAFVPLQLAAAGRHELAALGRPNALVITKLSTPDVVANQAELEALLDWLERDGADLRVCADLSDDYAALGRDMGHAYPARYQARLGERCEIVVPCEALARQLAPYARRGVRVIEDPWETPEAAAPRFAPGPTLRLAWFGNLGPMSLDGLVKGLRQAVQAVPERSVRIEIVAGVQRSELVEQVRQALAAAHPRLESVFTHWSVEATRRAIADADVVLIPQDTASEWGKVKSHNRLVETLRGGRLAVASPIASYVELDAYACVGEDLGAGLRWALDHPEECLARIAAGQRHIERRFAPEVVAAKWRDALSLPATGDARRLNLGCGDKILDGYVNVDVVASRAGRSPDVMCDLRDLHPFESDSVDEVLAVHVVEHFWRWEVLAVLKEWARVLRPGGRMVLECPNLLTACEELLRNPEASAGTGMEAQRTMWVFYGDPRWQDPLMTHRWNYTPQSLTALMEEAGLVNVRQEPAQYKLREPRDMRIVGEKPAAAA